MKEINILIRALLLMIVEKLTDKDEEMTLYYISRIKGELEKEIEIITT